jgi:hypothetical protein
MLGSGALAALPLLGRILIGAGSTETAWGWTAVFSGTGFVFGLFGVPGEPATTTPELSSEEARNAAAVANIVARRRVEILDVTARLLIAGAAKRRTGVGQPIEAGRLRERTLERVARRGAGPEQGAVPGRARIYAASLDDPPDSLQLPPESTDRPLRGLTGRSSSMPSTIPVGTSVAANVGMPQPSGQ